MATVAAALCPTRRVQLERGVFDALRNQLRLCHLIIFAPSAINQAIVFGEADPPGLHSSFVIARIFAKSAPSVVEFIGVRLGGRPTKSVSSVQVSGVRRHVTALKARTCPRTPNLIRVIRVIRGGLISVYSPGTP
jgi:hypothetical protein